MAIQARSSLWLLTGFAADIVATVAVTSHATTPPMATPARLTGHYSVSIDEIRQNLVFGDFFSDRYSHAVTLSDGSVHEVTLRAVSRNGQPLLELTDASDGKVAHSFMGPFGTTTNGKLMVNVKDEDEVRTEMHRLTGR